MTGDRNMSFEILTQMKNKERTIRKNKTIRETRMETKLKTGHGLGTTEGLRYYRGWNA